MERKNIATGTPWEPIVGYSRAVRLGQASTFQALRLRTRPERLWAWATPTHRPQALRNIEAALRAAGASLKDVLRTRLYVTNIADWEKVGRAHGEVFGEIRPATSMVEVSRLIAPEMLVEIEADAVISPPG